MINENNRRLDKSIQERAKYLELFKTKTKMIVLCLAAGFLTQITYAKASNAHTQDFKSLITEPSAQGPVKINEPKIPQLISQAEYYSNQLYKYNTFFSGFFAQLSSDDKFRLCMNYLQNPIPENIVDVESWIQSFTQHYYLQIYLYNYGKWINKDPVAQKALRDAIDQNLKFSCRPVLQERGYKVRTTIPNIRLTPSQPQPNPYGVRLLPIRPR